MTLVVVPLRQATVDATKFDFVGRPEQCPVQLCVAYKGSVYEGMCQPPETVAPSVGTTVIFTHGTHAGCVGTVNHVYSGEIFDVTATPMRSSLDPVRDDWVTDQDLVRQFRVPFRVLRAMMTRLKVIPQKVNIALTLYTDDKSRAVLGWCRFREQQTMFPRAVVGLLRQYVWMSGNLTQALKKEQAKGPRVIHVSDVWPGTKEEQDAKLQALIEWLRANAPAVKCPLVSGKILSLSAQATARVEEGAIEILSQTQGTRNVKGVVADIVVWQGKVTPPVSVEMPELGQRVVTAAASGPVPFAAHGTVVDVDPELNMVGVVFDQVMPCGTRLHGRIATNRGLVMFRRDLLLI
jgi:hypothetical protein